MSLWKRKHNKPNSAEPVSAIGREDGLKEEIPPKISLPSHIIISLLRGNEVYIGDTPLEEPPAEAVSYKAWRRDAPKYNNKSVIDDGQLRERLNGLLNEPTLVVSTPKDEYRLTGKPFNSLLMIRPLPGDDLPQRLKEIIEYGREKADLTVMLRHEDGTVHDIARRVTGDIRPPAGELMYGWWNNQVREMREQYGVPMFVDIARGFVMPITSDRHYCIVVDVMPSKN